MMDDAKNDQRLKQLFITGLKKLIWKASEMHTIFNQKKKKKTRKDEKLTIETKR